MLQSTESISQKMISRGFWLYLFTFLMGPLSYIVNILISSDLTVAQVGFFFSLTGLVSLLSVYSDMGMIESLNYYLPKYLVNKDYARAKGIFHFAIGVQICMTLFLTLVLYYGAIPLATYYFRSPQYTHIIEICSLFFIGLNILHIGTALFTVSQDTKMAKMADFVRAVCMAIGVVALYMSARGNVETYMWIYIISLFLGAVFGIFFAYRRYYAPYFSPVTAIYQRDILTPFAMYSLATLLTANIGMLFSQLDLQMVQYMLGLKEAGYYRQYLAIIGIPFLIFAPIVGFLFPLISEQHSRGNTQKIALIHGTLSTYFMLLSLWISVAFFFFGEHFAIIFFGVKFTPSGTILAYSAPFLVMNFLLQINFAVLAGTGRVKDRARILGLCLGINILLNYILIKYIGVEGSALAVGLSWIPLYVLSALAIRPIPTVIPYMLLFKNTIASVLLAYTTLYHILPILKPYIHAFSLAYIPSLVARSDALLELLFAIFISFCIFIPLNIPELKKLYVMIRQGRKE